MNFSFMIIKKPELKKIEKKRETVGSILENINLLKREEQKRLAERDKKRIEKISRSSNNLSLIRKKEEEKRNLRRQKTNQWINNFFGK